MRHLLRLQRSSLIYCALGLAAVIGWSSFAYLRWSARELSRQVSILTTERDEAIADRNAVRAKHEQLQRSAGELKQIEAKPTSDSASGGRRGAETRDPQQASGRGKRGRFSNRQHSPNSAQAARSLTGQ